MFSTLLRNKRPTQRSFAMSNKRKSVVISWQQIQSCQCLYFEFKDVFRAEDALEVIDAWKIMLDDFPEAQKPIIVWDCREMKGYESEARLLWQRALNKLKSKVGVIYLIADSVAIQLGADMVSYFTSLKIKTVKSRRSLENLLASA